MTCGYQFVVPEYVGRFIRFVLTGRERVSLLDPLGGSGLLQAWLAENIPDPHVDVVTQSSDAQASIRPFKLANLTVHVGSVQDVADEIAGHYDAIVSIPPVNRPKERRQYSLDWGRFELLDDPSLLAITDLAARLKPTGFFVIIVAPQFVRDKRPNSVRRNLGHFGLHLSALLNLRPGTFAGISASLELAIIDRKPRKAIFVAEIPGDLDAQKQLVERLRKRKQGPTPSQGRLVSEAQFHGLAALEARERYDKLTKGKGLKPFTFSRAVPDTCAPKRKDSNFEPFEDHPHAVYLPEMGLTNATVRQNELPPKLTFYLQLLVDPTIVLPEYLAGFFNTPTGHALRHMVMAGATIPRIHRSLLADSKLYLPSPEDQRLGLEAAHEIQRLRTELSELEPRIWQQPREASKVTKAVRKINHEERLSDWLEALPFPLAAILRSYHASDVTPKEKYERLLQFFEAFAEFCATIHLSAIRASAANWQPQREQIKKVLRQQGLSLETASFGSWRTIAELMASRLRSMLSNAEAQSLACAIYATADAAPLELLASRELVGLLQGANKLRNRWVGHGGAVGKAEANERHTLLQSDLAKFREIVGTQFLQYQLIEPREMSYLEGPIFRCRIRRAMGSNPQLEHDWIDLTTPAKNERLYLYNPGHNKSLELLPLVQIHDIPQPAGYFYNRLEKSRAHFVSYQVAAQSEISSASTDLVDLLMELKSEDEASEDATA